MITKERLNELLKAEKKLIALESGGVDNWEGYNESLKEFYAEDEKNELMESFAEELLNKLCDEIQKSSSLPGYDFSDNAQDVVLKVFKDLITEFENNHWYKEIKRCK